MKKYIAGIVIVAIVIVGIFVWKSGFRASDDSIKHNGVAGDPIDIALDFYRTWLAERNAGSDGNNLVHSQSLSNAMQEKLKGFDFSSDQTDLDPVLCQTVLPENFQSRIVFQNEDREQLLILSSNKEVPNQAIVSLELHDELWEITDIQCNAEGERGPDVGEFSFDATGHLLKDSLPSTFNKDYWYLVFEENGVPGHTVPLLLNSTSMCAGQDGAVNVCIPDQQLSEAKHVHIQGQMTELGVSVNRIEFLAN